MPEFNILVTGGTFDHFHKGHEVFLAHAFSLGEKVLIGITSDTFALQTRESEIIEPFATRENAVRQYLEKNNWLERSEIAPLTSVDIPKKWQSIPIEAILVTPNTLPGAVSINRERIRQKIDPLQVVEFPLLMAGDELPISSTAIRHGQINRSGDMYVPDTLLRSTMQLPATMRDELSYPFGDVTNFEKIDMTSIDTNMMITVGDVTTKNFLSKKIYPRLAVIDFTIEREKTFATFKDLGFLETESLFSATNAAGQISSSLLTVLKDIFERAEKKNVLYVHGEEDLAVLAVLLFAPLGYHIFYGQPSRGVVEVIVTEAIKEKAKELITKFERL